MAQVSAMKQPATHWLAKDSTREAIAGYLFILPTFLGYTAFVIGPILAAIGLSFSSYDILSPPQFVGLKNFATMLADPRLRTVYTNTIVFTIFANFFNITVGLLLAVLLNRSIPAALRYIFRSAYFFPVLVALVYSSIIWQFLYNKDTGIINYYLHFLGISAIPWLASPKWVMPSIIIMDVWKNTGFDMLVFLAGLQNISPAYYEAAQLDGANRWQMFRHVTIPLISPTLFFTLIINLIGALQVFDSIIVLTGGGPGDASRSLVMYITENAFSFFRLGYASAVAITLFLVIMTLTLIQFRISRSWVHYE